MMESITSFICIHAVDAHWMIFGLLMLAGLNVPISEDVLLLTGGAIASTCIPDQTLHLFAWIATGCWISAWEAYWIGRRFGPKLYDIRWFGRVVTPRRIEKLSSYYEKFGIWTFIVGRFIPGGVRNALFMTAGMGKMPFITFIIRDGAGCLLSTLTLFYIGYSFGQNYPVVINAFEKYQLLALIGVGVAVGVIGAIFWVTKKTSQRDAVLSSEEMLDV